MPFAFAGGANFGGLEDELRDAEKSQEDIVGPNVCQA
jgi:hypothetical protein